MPKLIAPVVAAGAMRSTAQPELDVDEALMLRPWQHTDAAVLIEAFSTADIQHWHFRRIDTESEAGEWIAECADGWSSERGATWAIVELATLQIAGRVSVYTFLEGGRGEVSYWVLPHARGKGLATRACIAATRWAHALGLHRIELQHSTRNVASGRVARSSGFTPEGVQRQAHLHADGWHDMQLYSHLSSDLSPTP